MRPRKKVHLEPRLEACASIMIHPPVMEAPEGSTFREAALSLLPGFWIREAFPNPDAPLHLEIGCGKGQFICALAALHPEINFVAMEREANVAVITAERIFRADPPLPNLRLLMEDAERLPQFFSAGELERIYINFCDPWHKHRQFKKRLTYRERLKAYERLLIPGGEIHFKTDNYMLYHFSTFEFEAVMPPYFQTTDLHHSDYAPGNLMTEYETYFSGLGQPIYAIRAKKAP